MRSEEIDIVGEFHPPPMVALAVQPDGTREDELILGQVYVKGKFNINFQIAVFINKRI